MQLSFAPFPWLARDGDLSHALIDTFLLLLKAGHIIDMLGNHMTCFVVF